MNACTWPDCGHDGNGSDPVPGCKGTGCLKEAEGGEALVADLRKELPFSKMTHNFTFSRDEMNAILKHFDDAIARRNAEIARLQAACVLARNTFEGYAALHREKGTPEGDSKAALNNELAKHTNAAIKEKTR